MSSQKNDPPARSFSTLSRSRWSSSLPRSWTTVQVFGGMRLRGTVIVDASPSPTAALPTPARGLRQQERRHDGEDERDRLLAAELRLAAGALGHVDRHLFEPQSVVDDPDQRLHLRRAALERARQQRQRLRVDRVEAARGVAERAPEDER